MLIRAREMQTTQEYFGIEVSKSVFLALALENIEVFDHFLHQSICPIPEVPHFWYGVTNQRDSLLWVLDTEQFLDLPTTRIQPNQKLTTVVLNQSRGKTKKRVALVAKQLKGVISLDTETFEPTIAAPKSRLGHICPTTGKEVQENRAFAIVDSDIFFQTLNHQLELL